MLAGCQSELPPGSLIVTQSTLEKTGAAADSLERLYPPGSRIACIVPPYKAGQERILSAGLYTAGCPILSPDAQHVYFAGKEKVGAAWQIYENAPGGGRLKRMTAMPGGAMYPAQAGNGDLVFCSPVPEDGRTWTASNPPALYRQAPDGTPRRITFGAAAAIEPTVMRDGTILFVSAKPASGTAAVPRLGLFTVNDDGTEVTAYAVDNDGAPGISRPRELLDGRVGFLASAEPASPVKWGEAVRQARPFASRAPLFSFPTSACRAVEPDGQGAWLACLRTQGLMGRAMSGSLAVFRVTSDARSLGTPLFDNPAWNELEALPVAPRPKPMGHVSAIKLALKTGTLLCLNAHFTRLASSQSSGALAVKVRVLARRAPDKEIVLGETALQADGSFMAAVPAEVPLGFELLDGQDQVIHRLSPSIWLRPGENRSCLGCHEPYNRTPRNARPIAAGLPPANLTGKMLATP
jgi:hypothetical protein